MENETITLIIVGLTIILLLNLFTICVDRNRNIAYGRLFNKYGLEIYNITDRDIRANKTLQNIVGFQDTIEYTLCKIENISFEYPFTSLLFFVILSYLPLNVYAEGLLVNLIFLTITIYGIKHLREINNGKITAIISFLMIFLAGMGKLDSVMLSFLVLSFYHYKKRNYKKMYIFLGLSAITKYVTIIYLPWLVYKTKSYKKTIYFFITTLPLLIIGIFAPQTFKIFVNHL